MSLIRLRTFVEVYRQRSISGAARALNLTQPAVSQHIAGLEIAIGRRLFERQPRGVAPTAAADELAADIGDKLDAAEAALSSARARSIEVAGALQIIGHGDFLAEVVTPQLLPLLESGIRIRMQTGDRELITAMLVEGLSDLGISGSPIGDKRLRCELLRNEKVIAVAAPAVAGKLMAAKDLHAALSEEPLLAYNLELPLIDNWLARNRVEIKQLQPAMIGQDLRTLCGLLCQGFGWSVLPEYLCRSQISRGELREIKAPVGADSLGYYLVWAPSALRQPRIAHARQTLLWRLKTSARSTAVVDSPK